MACNESGGSTVTIANSLSAKGVKGDSLVVIDGGTIRVLSSDDGVNLAGAGDTQPGAPGSGSSKYALRINGGRITVFASGDGIDANGSIAMTGGPAIVHGRTANNNAPVDFGGTESGTATDGIFESGNYTPSTSSSSFTLSSIVSRLSF